MAKRKISRDELIARSAEIFRKKGYYSTTMNDIGIACGLLKGSIYHYFHSKEELMIEVLKTKYKEAGEHIFSIARDKDIPPLVRLSMMFDIPEKGLFSNGTEDGGCLFGSIGLEIGSHIPEFNEVIKVHFDAYMEAFETIFLELVNRDQAKELAAQAVVEMEGAVLLSVIYSDTRFYTGAKHRILSHFS
jgi:TetR/AcrR family transcriptional repressor of nem operon